MFLKIVRKWSDIVNVKSSQKHRRLRKDDCRPFTQDWKNDDRISWLKSFVKWLDVWHTDDRFKDHRLSKETYEALSQSTTVLLQVIEYVFENDVELKRHYFLTGKMQTDQLERRFGKYRWLSGSNYKVSMKNVLVSEKKMRNRHTTMYQLVKEGLEDKTSTVSTLFGEKQAAQKPTREEILEKFGQIFDTEYQENINEVEIECITHVAGSCGRKALQTLEKAGKCSTCIERFICGRG